MSRVGMILLATALVSFTVLAPASNPGPNDEVYLRNGEVWQGTVIRETTLDYSFLPSVVSGTLCRIPRDAVRFVLYAEPAKADAALGLGQTRRQSMVAPPAPIRILTAEGLGQAILESVRQARTSVWISGYAFNGYLEGAIGAFYAVLAAKAKTGVDVVILAEYGQATPPSVKQATRNFVEEMARNGMRVFLLSERKALHKKMVIVDGRLVFMGSSNLTSAGTLYNEDLNLGTESPEFAKQVISDFERIRKRAVPLEKWRD